MPIVVIKRQRLIWGGYPHQDLRATYPEPALAAVKARGAKLGDSRIEEVRPQALTSYQARAENTTADRGRAGPRKELT